MFLLCFFQSLKSGGSPIPSGTTATALSSSASSEGRGGRMRFNKAEVAALASQPSSVDKEGTLFVRERQEGFFRRTESELDQNAFS